ncbi:hypothetical protein RESH_04912 [Rhodopirellula europaea SH398]|uniref:Uncharacterized protein n=1 Tax=Rhodopirellula europaea SH398 TaxID=1263868 RepID=M5RZA2_9BACT|nr:hypothetical protein RESH_04912 [Rhodopirellula europaea SH398]
MRRPAARWHRQTIFHHDRVGRFTPAPSGAISWMAPEESALVARGVSPENRWHPIGPSPRMGPALVCML